MRKLAANCILNQATRLIICIPILLTTHVVVGELKTKSSENLFRKLNEHSKNLQAKQEEIIKKHNSLSAQHKELEHLKVNMDDYLGNERNSNKKSKKSIVKQINDIREIENSGCSRINRNMDIDNSNLNFD